ncbi:MAG: GNAT family N-acetyltransferase [Romboutsia sp.]|uniref:GNAT family N-acetyltransferase n=1 Tax=Romboutsia sp. TaxID=1965302 RepID=UPI003F2D40DD
MYLKKLIGNKVYLSPIDRNDYVKYTQWVNDMDVAIGMTFANMLIDEEAEKNSLDRLSKAPFNFAIILKETNQVIGNVGFPKLDYINKLGEVGIFIGDKESWGNGYGNEALSLLLDFGFNLLNLNNIYLKVYSFNRQAIKCYSKVGFKEVGRLREAKIIGCNKYDEVCMDILANEFKSPYILSVLEKKLNL